MLKEVRGWIDKAHWLTLLLVFLVCYIVYVALANIGGVVLVRLSDRFLPDAIFYHLQPGEDPGPLDWEPLGISIVANYLVFFAVLVPMARLLRVPFFVTFLLGILNVPIVLLFLFGVIFLVELLGVRPH